MLRKIIGMVLITVFSMSFSVNAAEKEPSKVSFNSVLDWSENQGENSWYYQYTTDGTYTDYKDMTWVTKGSNTTYHGSNASGAYVDNFYVKQNSMHIGGGNLKPARVWVAPYPGVVRVASIGNVRKTSVHTAGEVIKASVVKTDADKKNEEVLWTCNVKQGDNIGNGNSYSFDVDVKAGDRIYFETSAASAANGGVIWETKVDYIQVAYFSKDAKKITTTADLTSECRVDCTFYDLKKIDENSKLYMVVYDESGRMRAMSTMSRIEIDSFEYRKADISVIMPMSESGFSGWSVRLFGITDISGRYWPIEISDAISLN